jgi:hypothetical protein
MYTLIYISLNLFLPIVTPFAVGIDGHVCRNCKCRLPVLDLRLRKTKFRKQTEVSVFRCCNCWKYRYIHIHICCRFRRETEA